MKKINYDTLPLTVSQKKVLEDLSKKQNGAYLTIEYETNVTSKVKAAYRNYYKIIKTTRMSIRKGVHYDRLKSVINRRMGLGPNIPSKPTWFEHVNDDVMLVKHKDKDQYYIMAYLNPFGHPHPTYKVNGKEMTKQELQNLGIMQDSFWKDSDKPEVMTLNIDGIKQIF